MKMGLLPPANAVCEADVFTGVCLSTGGVSVMETPRYGNVRAVRILLECILVLEFSITSHNQTRKHSSRMCSASWHRPYVLQYPLDVSSSGDGGPEVNKFKQVCSDGHQMSLTGES